jgi:uncharacterized membrane protein YczE
VRDQDQLKVLAILHFVWSGIVAAFAGVSLLFGLTLGRLEAGMMSSLVGSGSSTANYDEAMAKSILCILLFALAIAVAGFCIVKRRAYPFVLVVTCVDLLAFPIGTGLVLHLRPNRPAAAIR